MRWCPLALPKTLGVTDEQLINLGDQGLNRPVRFVARKSTYSLPVVLNFYKALSNHLNKQSL